MNQQQKIAKFRQLHEAPGLFVMPNPWDIGSARILAAMNFDALATTSAGFAHSLGVRDGKVNYEQVLQHCRMIVEATDLPVSADLEKGFGDTPEDVADTIRKAAATGLVGCSIEDHTNRPEDPIFEFNLAVERIQAAVEAKRSLPHDFVLTARCENFSWNREDLDDTIKRLQAFESAGADVLYAPGLRNLNTIEMVCQAIKKPVNVVVDAPGANITLKELAEVGVKRISLGSAPFLTAYGALIRAVKEIQQFESFTFLSSGIGFAELESIFSYFEK